jgi:hypothetical protein
MKKLLLLFILIGFALGTYAQVSKTVNLAIAGTLSSTLTVDELNTVTNLTITGNIDARDFKTMRDLMPVLADVDFSGTTIMAYSGTEGTFGSVMIDYIGNELPKSAFQDKGTLSSIIIPSTVTSIGDVAFQQCIKLKSVNFVLPSSLKSIGWIAFTGCTALESISIPASTNLISELAFVNCSNLKSVSIPASLQSIGKDAFLNTQAIFSVDASNSKYSALEGMLLSRDMSFLYVCTNYKTGDLFVPATVKTIGGNAFKGCNKLTSILLPKSILYINSNAFDNCTGLTSIYSHNSIPPSLFSDAFKNLDQTSCVLLVPAGSEGSYSAASQWKDFGHIESMTKGYNIDDVETLKLIRDNAPSDSPLKNEWAYESNIDEWTGVTWESIQDQKRITTLVISSKKLNSLDLRSLTYLQRLECYWNNISELNVSGLENLQGLYCGGNQITTLNLQGLRNLQHLFCYANLLQSLDVSSLTNLTQLGCWDNMLNFLNINGLSKIERIHVGGNSLPFSVLKQLLPLNLPIATVNLNGMSYSPQGVNGLFAESKINIGTEIDFSSESDINGIATTFNWYKNDQLIQNTDQTGKYTPSETGIYNCVMTNLKFPNLTLKTSKITVIDGKKSVNVSVPGTISSLLTPSELGYIMKLTLTGTIDARDFKTMRDLMPVLAEVDLSGVTIAEYTGTEGTAGTQLITYPAQEVPRNAFYNKLSLTSISIPLSSKTIGRSAFNNCDRLTQVTFGANSQIETIGYLSFAYCDNLTNMQIPSNVTIIDYGAFRQCSALVTCNLPESVRTIGNVAFYWCYKLKDIIIQKNVESIGEFAFHSCSEILSFNIPASTMLIGRGAFIGASGAVNVEESNTKYSSQNGVLYDKNKTQLIYCPPATSGDFVIPATVSTVAVDAFYNCSELTSITLPEGLTTLEDWAFEECSGLTTISLPASLNSIGSNSFYNCTGLSSIYVSNATPVDLSTKTDVFLGINKTTCTLYVPSGSENLYKAANQWKDFTHIVASNQVPVANAGVDQSVNENTIATLNGSASSDPDGNTITYKWTAPAGINLSSTTVANPTFTAPEVSSDTPYTFSLVVNDGLLNSTADQVIVTVKQVNKGPIANAGVDQTVNEGSTVSLNGSASSDPEGKPLTYIWKAPCGIVISSYSSSTPSFTAPRVSSNSVLTFTLIVNNGEKDSQEDQVVINLTNIEVEPQIDPVAVPVYCSPIADAGTNQTVKNGSVVTLDGSSSAFCNESVGEYYKLHLYYYWKAPESVKLSSCYSVNPTVTFPDVVLETSFTFSLIVSDGCSYSKSDDVTITVKENSSPVANAGSDQSVNEGATVTLDGSLSSDPDGTAVTYLWTAPAGITLSSATATKPTFTTPEVTADKTYTFSLVVNDGTTSSTADEVIVTVKQVNKAPVANAGTDQSVNEGATVTLDGSLSSDPDGTAVTYLWTAPAGVTLNSASVVKPTFTTPEVTADKTYIFSLVVNDGTTSSTADEVTVTVKQVNKVPVANAGADQSVNEGTAVTLDGSLSSDPDGTAVTFLWTAPSGVTLSSLSVAKPTFTTPEVTADKTYIFSLVVNDGIDSSIADEVIITVKQVNQVPVANAGTDQSVNEGTTLTLDGSASFDLDNDALTYLWTAPVGITLSSASATKPTFTAPEVTADKTYTFSLMVNDGIDSSTADEVTVTVKQVNKVPVANAGSDQSVNEGATVTLDGSLSSDPDGTAVTYLWTAPAGVSLSSPSVVKPTFTAPEVTADKTYIFSLVVKDGTTSSTADEVIVTVKQVNKVPVANAGADQSVNEGATVTLDGSLSSDPDGTAVTLLWTAPAGITLSSATATKPTFTAPEVTADKTYTFSLVVKDGTTSSTADEITVTVKQVNKVPVANAGADQSVNEGATVTLDGSLSSDPDGTAVTYLWTEPAGITLNSTTSAKPTFTAPKVSADTPYTFTLVVNDGKASSTGSKVVVWVKHIPPFLSMASKMKNVVIPVANLSYQLFKKSGTSFIEKKIVPEVIGDFARFIVESGEWIVLVSSSKDAPAFIPTYVGNVTNWANAEIISIPENGTISKTIDCLAPEPTNTGTGEISGNVYEKQGTGAKSVSIIQVQTGTETPIAGAMVHLFKKGGMSPVSYCFTDVNGFYKFEKLPIADYEIVVELPGFTQSEKLPVKLEENASSVSVYFAVNTTTQVITSNNSLLASLLKIYPNPVMGSANIDLGENIDEPVWMAVYGIQGNLLIKQLLKEQKSVVDLTQLVAGSYLVRITYGKETQLKILIKK